MAKALVIVESPAKAKTINKFLGDRFIVKASMGHVRDLPSKTLGVDEDNDFEPVYEVLKDRAAVVKELKSAASKASAIFIATDPDREGEAIGWHIAQLLDPDESRTQRVTFNEITKKAVLGAFDNPQALDVHKVDAQQTRRILDRLVGYKISPLLWKKVRRGLSAGRVQSVALKMVCDRERDIRAFQPEEYWTIAARLEATDPPQFSAKLFRLGEDRLVPKSQAESDSVLQALEGARWLVRAVERKERRRNPQPPFITSKLQQEAVKQLRFSVKKTMMLAQRLYEGKELGSDGAVGLITYMRTDSTRVADDAIEALRAHISSSYGPASLPEKPRVFASKKGAQDAHEAIRPTAMERTPESLRPHLEPDEYRLYKLIWNRFVASQMNPALYDQTIVDVEAAAYTFRATGSVLKDKGYLAVYEESSDAEEDAATLPPLREGQDLRLLGLDADQHFTEPPPRYTEATLVKALEENGIGRPSTYAQILATIQDRQYTVKQEGKFLPTELGFLIEELLGKNFADIVDPGYTAKMEEELDRIEEGNLRWSDALREFNLKFAADLVRADAEMRDVKREEIPTGESCDKCGKPMVRKFGRFGSFVACSGYPECRNTREVAASGTEGSAIELPEKVAACEKCGSEMVLKRGRFGPFLACTGYPGCKNTRRLVKNAAGQVEAAETKPLDETCKECGKPLVLKHGRFGAFAACSDYPTCKYIKRDEVGVPCPKDGAAIVARRSKRGKQFFGCSNYPNCDFVLWYRPVQTPCPQCQATFLLERSSKKTGAFLACATEGCDYKSEPIEAAAKA